MPFDVQNCPIHLGLYRSQADAVVIEWRRDSAGMPFGWVWTAPSLPTEWGARPLPAENRINNFSGGDYSSSVAFLELRRHPMALVGFAVVPSIIFVLASYSGFFVSAAAAPARVALGFLCTLMVLNNMNAIRGDLPEGLSFSDSWLLAFMYGCTIFNLLALFEYAAVNFYSSLKAKATAEDKNNVKVDLWGVPPTTQTRASSSSARIESIRGKISELDRTCRWFFPMAFFFYLVVMVVLIVVMPKQGFSSL